jgi:hypothetical protein
MIMGMGTQQKGGWGRDKGRRRGRENENREKTV